MIQKNKIDVMNGVMFAWTFMITSYISYKMLSFNGDGRFSSDYPSHLSAALAGKGYSLMALIMRGLYILGDVKAIAIFMGLCVAISGIVVRAIIINVSGFRLDFSRGRGNLITIISYSILFISSINIPQKAPFYLLTYENGLFVPLENGFVFSYLTQPLHNSTYVGMRLFALLSIMFVLKIHKDGEIYTYVMLFFSLTLTNLFKPNFIIAFMPAYFVFALWDYVVGKNYELKRHIIIMLELVLSMFPLVYQYLVLFGKESNGAGIIITDNYLVDYIKSGYFAWSIISTFTVPILVSILLLKNKEKDKMIILAWLFEIITFIQATLLKETGPRSMHGNFWWNMMFSSLFLFIYCVSYLVKLSSNKKENKYEYLFIDISWALLAIHLINGFMYLGIIYSGRGYGC